MRNFMLAICALAQLVDVITTNAILDRGGWESNPLMAWAQASLGSGWIIPKIGLTLALLWLLKRSKKRHIVAFAIVLLCLAPLNNALVLLTM